MSKGFAKNFSEPGKLITTIILLVIALQVVVQTIPLVIASIINLSTITSNASGTPVGLSFQSFFAANGVVLLGLSAAIVLGILAVFGLAKGKR